MSSSSSEEVYVTTRTARADHEPPVNSPAAGTRARARALADQQADAVAEQLPLQAEEDHAQDAENKEAEGGGEQAPLEVPHPVVPLEEQPPLLNVAPAVVNAVYAGVDIVKQVQAAQNVEAGANELDVGANEAAAAAENVGEGSEAGSTSTNGAGVVIIEVQDSDAESYT